MELARVRVEFRPLLALLCATLLAPSHRNHRTLVRTADDLDRASDIWTENRTPGEPIDIVVNSDEIEPGDQVIVDDIDAAADAERERIAHSTAKEFYAEYRDNAAINGKLRELAALAPDRTQLAQIGTSVEGRPILALRVGRGPEKMLLNGTQHAREWIASMTTTCIADRLVRGGDSKFLADHTVWIVPVANPDGYAYSWEKKRYWRKNRRDGHGVDLNRNWGVAWGGAGSSGGKNSDVYRGPSAFSEPETRALRDLTLKEKFSTHVDFHSYGQLILYPWSYKSAPAADRDRFRGIGDRMNAAIYAQHESTYKLQSGADLYPAAGTATDWMYGEANALSYTIELRPKSGGGLGGFVLPPEQIVPTCDEAMAAVMALP